MRNSPPFQGIPPRPFRKLLALCAVGIAADIGPGYLPLQVVFVTMALLVLWNLE